MRKYHEKLLDELRSVFIIGFEDDDEQEENEEENEENEEENEEQEESDSSNNEGLKSALRKERKERRQAQRELKALQKKSTSDQENLDLEAARASAEASKGQVTKLTEKLANSEVNNVILRLAGDFIDPSDALTMVSREDIDFDQDAEDPSQVSVDEDSVKEALQELAKKKPHLLKSEDNEEGDEEESSGPPRSGRKTKKGNKSGKGLDDEALRAKYPALQRGMLK